MGNRDLIFSYFIATLQESSSGSKLSGPQHNGSLVAEEGQKQAEALAEAAVNLAGLSGHAKSVEPEILAQE